MHLKLRDQHCARFGSIYTKIGTIQRRLASPLRKDDTQIREAFRIFEINPLSVASFAIIFSQSEGCLFTLLIVSFVVQKLLSKNMERFTNLCVILAQGPC